MSSGDGDVPAIEIAPAHWAMVRDILQAHVPGLEVWAFGSRARHCAKPYSDLDLVVISDTPLSVQAHGGLIEDFSDSDLPWKVDVVDWATTSAAFREIIRSHRVVVQAGAGDPG
jgi:type I restriction enzyme S subunit